MTTINNYITLNEKTYRVVFDGKATSIEAPVSVERGVTGKTLVSVGQGDADMFLEMVLHIPWAENLGTNEGGTADILALATAGVVSYTGHVSDTEAESGTFDVVLTDRSEIIQLGPSPRSGYRVRIVLQKVLS